MTDVLIDRFLKNREQDAAKNQFRTSLVYGMQQNPDAQVKVQRTAGVLGTTPAAVQADPSYFEQAANAQTFDYDSYIKRAPVAANWLSHPENAAVAHDDTNILASLEDVASQIAQFPQKAMGGLFRSVGGASMLAGSNPLLKAWLFPGNEASATAAREVGQDVRNYYQPLFTSPSLLPTTTAGRGAEFVSGIAGAIAKAVGTGPFAPLVFGAEAFGESAGSALERGATPWQATGKAVGSGAINTLLGLIPGSKFGGEEALGEAIKRGGIASIIGEAAKGVGVRAARGTVLGTGVTVGENLLDRATGIPNKHLLEGATENIKTFIGMELAGYMSHAIAATAESKLKKRSEVAFNSAVTEMFKGSGVEEIGIPADKIELLFQGGGADPVSVASEIRTRLGDDMANRYLAAKATGADVTMKTADFLAKLDPEQHKALLQDVRMNPDLPTLRERQEWEKSDGPERMKQLLRQDVTPEESSSTDYKTVFEEARRRFVAAGERPEVADDYATLQANVYTNLARESGHTAAELFRLYDPKVVVGEVGSTLKPGGTDVTLGNAGRGTGEPGGLGDVHAAGSGPHDGPAGAGGAAVPPRRNPAGGLPLGTGPLPEGLTYHGSEVPVLPANGLSVSFAKDGSQLAKALYVTDTPGTPEVGPRHYATRNGEGSVHELQHRIQAPVDLSPERFYSREEAAALGVEVPAVMDEISGAAIWRNLEQQHGSREAASQFLMDHGYDSGFHLDPKTGTRVWAIWDQQSVGQSRTIERNGAPVDEPWKEVMQHGEGQGQGQEGRQGLLGGQGGPGGSPDLLLQSVDLRTGKETLGKYGLDPNERYTVREVAQALEERQRERFGTIDQADRSEKTAKRISKWMAEEVAFELQHPDQSGAGWYSEKFQRALDQMAALHPELKTDQNARDLLTALIAITSDGQKVIPNFRMALDLYGNFKKTGKFETEIGHNRDLSKNIERIQTLHDEMGPEKMRGYLLQEATVSELKKIAKAQGADLSSDYQAHIKLPMAAIELGPKLGAFYANLMGADGYLTMDRWWSRTFNRYRGQVIPEVSDQGVERLKQLLGKPELSWEATVEEATKLMESYKAKGYKNGTEAEKAGNTIWKQAYGTLEDAPYNATDRTFMLRTVEPARKELEKQGHKVSTADVQAILWYYEKRLYGELGARQSADVSYEEAARQVSGGDRPGGRDLQGGLAQDPGRAPEGEPGPAAAGTSGPEGIGTLFQPGESKPPRGWFRVLPDGTYEIGKTKIGDLSTFMHEPAHSYLYMMRDLAALPTASESLKGDFAKTLKWLGAGTWEDVVADYQKHEAAGTVKDSMLEKWARGNEAYIREGKAPTEGLRGVFQRFSVWLGSIYRKASSLGVELDPEIRGVMDRLYAGDRAVDEAQKIVDVRPLFTSAEMMGWTQAEYDLYAGKAADAVSSAHAAVNERLQREYQRERETWWKDETANVRAGVLEEIDADPTYRAISILKDGELPVVGEDGAQTRVPVKLNRQAIIDQFGEETLKKLPHGLRDHKGAGTMDAEAAAELLGFDSGHALIDAITKAEPKNDLVERLTTERMKEKHGDLQTAGLDSISVEALHNKAREEMLHAELQALRKKERELKPGRELQRKIDEASSESERQAAQDAWDAYQKDQKAIAAEGRQQARAATEVPPTASFREAARDFVSEQTPRDLDPYSYLLASRREAKRAFDAMAKDDYSTAADAKQKELLNHHMYLEATKAKVEAAKIFEYGRKGQTPDFQGKLGLAGREFQDQWNALAERVEFRKVTDTELDTRTVLRGLGEWQKEFEEDGAHIDPILLAGGPPRNWREVPMSELRAVRDGLKNIETVAKAQLGAILDGIKLDLEREAGLLDTAARTSLGSKPVPRQGTKLSLLERAQTKLQGFNSYMQKLEWAIDQLDGGDINGPARRNIKAPIDNASAREKEMGHEVKLKLMEVFKDRTQQERSHEFDGIGVRFPGMDRDLNRMQLFSWALNLGTAENRKVATLGEGLIAEDGTLRPEFEQALSKLTSAEARRLQGVWDALESMRPAIIEKERRTTGIEPKLKEVTPLTFKTADGEVVNLQGGYYPLKADPNIDNVGRRQVDPANMVGKYGLPKVSDSHTQAVTGATYRLLLDYPTVLGQHVPAVIKNVTMGEAIKYVSKFITRDDVSATLKETLGLEKETEFEPWLKAVAGNGMDNDQGGPVMRWLMGRRMGMVTARLGGNLTSYFVQLGDSTKLLANESASYLTKELPQAYLDIRRDPKGVIEDIRRLSPNEMRFREENFNREIRDLLTSKDILDESKQRVTEFLMTGFQVMDRLQTFPAWLAKYREGMGAHGDEGQAVREADRLIARTFQAGEARNLSRVMREQGLMKMFTTFQGDANTWYGILSSAFESKNVKRISVGLMAVIAEQMLSSVIRGRIPSDEDKLAGWTLGNVMSAMFNPLGIFGDFADFATKKATGQFAKFNNPTLDAIEKAVTIPAAGKAYHEGRKDAEGLALDVVEAAGLWAGIPGTGQLIKSWKYQHGLRTGTQPAPSSTAAEVAHTLLGPPPKEK